MSQDLGDPGKCGPRAASNSSVVCCKEMAELSKVPSSTIHQTLKCIEDLWLQYVTVRWVPHHLDDSQEAGNKSSLPNNFLDAIDEKAASCQNWLCILNDIYSSAQRAGAAAAEC
ncbi:hypothetical protein BOX15_Mlig034000g1 [Macrostomum lignano]|uniref:Uncharacterized protein n=1 Tax=Macrostomum lignano TaxID=282301 RepID=A0A267FFX4_9PLAT|nr:hypothetical protein BOX15_Mlig034000g1 [Macrostomum lignano]